MAEDRYVRLICRSEVNQFGCQGLRRGHSTTVMISQKLLLLLIAVVAFVEGLGRFSEEENSPPFFRPEPLGRLPDMVEVHQAHPPGFAPPPDMIKTLRREHNSDVAMSVHRGRARLMGFSRRRRPSNDRH